MSLTLSAEGTLLANFHVRERIAFHRKVIQERRKRRSVEPESTSGSSRWTGARLPDSVLADTSYGSLTTVRTRSIADPDFVTTDGHFSFKTIAGDRYVVKRYGATISNNLIGWPEIGSIIHLEANDSTRNNYTARVAELFVAPRASSGSVRLVDLTLNFGNA